ncbi:elongation of very long chain fatty acids protein 4 [Anopheles ziemanni]|uniref:elongation of very long chain fatty acids protein 4 n=1 Tax=Anopheles coustani TaxID=139045 RepID=UPI002659A008|nr:elongation of very long chain fatty acids protein 4 [Anopheles coustani]XP_058178969.1 elongation of very long chain fatty acids protein 4 [Anopheles ziemanni]
MSSYVERISVQYKNFSEGADPLIDSWTLMQTPTPILSITGLYLLFVLWIGPRWMERRKPFELKHTLIVYNALQVVVSTWFCLQPFFTGIFTKYLSATCEGSMTGVSKELQLTVWNGAWMYLMLKIVELLDTVFFVLRKKQNQVSFLHVYHHTIMVLFTWFYLKYIPGMQAAFIGVLNSFVHIIMYSYYLIAALGPRYQKYLWWKKYMTTLQLLQFGIMLCYFVLINSMQCHVPRALTYFFVSNITIFLFLFINFYRKAYQNRPKALKKE